MNLQQTFLMNAVYFFAAFFEIAGCFGFWSVLKLGKPVWWLFPSLFALVMFALLLTRIEVDMAGRAFAAYGGIYIFSSLLWLWVVESQQPDRWDIMGVSFCLFGSLIILLGKHTAS